VAGAASYEWQLPEGWIGAENDRIIHPLPNANGGLASVVVTNACGITDSASISVSVTERVDSIYTILGPTVMCFGDTATFSVVGDSNATDYNWQTTGSTTNINNNTIAVLAGNQDFFISVQSVNDCGLSNYVTLTVSVPDSNTSPANFNADCTVNDDDMQQLLEHYGCMENCSAFDLNNDGYVGVEDILLFIEFAAQ
jgi:hypothetical protein